VVATRNANVYRAPHDLPWAVVLRVPGFAADHAVAHRSDHFLARTGPPPGATVVDDTAVRDLLRQAAGFLTEDTTGDPVELPEVGRWRSRERAAHRLRLLTTCVEYDSYPPDGWGVSSRAG
jgi:hypothetical protein